MKEQEVFNKIGGIIRELNEQYAYMQSAGNLFNDLELELMAANTNFLAGHIEILRKINKNADTLKQAESKASANGAMVQPGLTVQPEIPEPASPQKPEPFEDKPAELEPPKQEEVSIIYEFERQEIIRHELTLDDVEDDWDEEDTEENIPETKVFDNDLYKPEVVKGPALPMAEAEAALENTPFTAAAKPVITTEPVITLNERISAQLAATRKPDPAGLPPISDLKGAINLNDKLLYIKDLFHGYSLAYSEALEILNRLSSFEEARQYLNSTYAIKNNWAGKEDTAEKFYALLQRRYINS